MKIVEINDFKEFLSLEQEWHEVLERCDHTIFSTWEWLTTWWKHCGYNKKLVLLLVEDGGTIIGIAPLMYSTHSFLGLRTGNIRFIGSERPRSDYSDFILADKYDECIKLFVEFLKRTTHKWDIMDLINIPENSKTLLYVKKEARFLKPLIACPYMQLPESHEMFLNSLNRELRKSIRKNSRRLAENFVVDFVDTSKDTKIAGAMRVFFDLHQKRWTTMGLPGAFIDHRSIDFHLDIAESFSRKGWLGLFQLRLSGLPVAARYGFKYKSKYYAYLSGFDPRFSEFGLGNLLISFVVAECIKKNISEFDFMRGAEEYKKHWNTFTRWNHQALIVRPGAVGSIKYTLGDQYWHIRRRLKRFEKAFSNQGTASPI